jgi:hypothetical protein
VLAIAAGRIYGAPGAAAALLAGGLINAIASLILMRQAIGAVRLSAAMPAAVTCLASILVGLVASWLAGRTAGALLACALYAAVAVSQLDLTRLRRAWEGHS